MRTPVVLGCFIILWGCCRSSDQDFHARSWPKITLPSLDSASVTLHTAWREGKMSWTLVIVPTKGRLTNPREFDFSNLTFTIQMRDSNGIDLLTIPVTFDSWAVAGNNPEGYSISVNNSVDCTPEIYSALSSWACSWGLRAVGAGSVRVIPLTKRPNAEAGKGTGTNALCIRILRITRPGSGSVIMKQ